MPDATLTVAKAAKRLKVAPNTVYDLVARSELRHHRIGCQRALKTSHLWALENQPS
jgi:excisionase family DNA binding protein